MTRGQNFETMCGKINEQLYQARRRARRRFCVICKKPEGGAEINPPPGVRVLSSRSHKLVEQVSTGDASAKHFCSGAGFRKNQNIFWQNVFECWGAFKASCANDDEILINQYIFQRGC